MTFSLTRKAAPLSAIALCVALPAQADLSISTRATHDVSCSNGVCTATAKNAALNINDLTGMLGAGDLKVAAGGGAQDIRVDASLGWLNASVLTLDAVRSVTVNHTMKIQGSGGLAVITDDGGINGLFSFGTNGRVTFANLNSTLAINGQSYALERKISTLAAAIARNPGGSYALANNYDAAGDGTYDAPPIATAFVGTFEGLGSTISNLSINSSTATNLGLFADIGSSGTLANTRLVNASVAGTSSQVTAAIGALAGLNEGTILGATTTGSVTGSAGNYAFVGGLAGANTGSIAYAHSAAGVTAGPSGFVGGLVGFAESGTIYASSATGTVSSGQGGMAGGLVGDNGAHVTQCFATGTVTSDVESKTGGLVGFDSGPINDSYAAGAASQAETLGYVGGLVGFFQPDGTNILTRNYSLGAVSGGNFAGGLVGFDNSSGTNLAQNYWNMTTSGISNPSGGAGNVQNDPGITGLTSHQLRSRLPSGFHRSTWAQDRAINQGFPYLRANPPGN